MDRPPMVETRAERSRVLRLDAQGGVLFVEIDGAGGPIRKQVRHADEPGLELLADLDRSLVRSAVLALAAAGERPIGGL